LRQHAIRATIQLQPSMEVLPDRYRSRARKALSAHRRTETFSSACTSSEPARVCRFERPKTTHRKRET
jgi:hypothetical protein